MDFPALLARTQSMTPGTLSRLRELVEAESPSEDPAAVNRAMEMVAGWAVELGGKVKRHRQKGFGDVFELRFGPRPASRRPIPGRRKPILLLGHLDTVWAHGTLKTMPWREDGGRIYGPGTMDMKVGVMMALAAVALLKELGQLPPVTLLLNPDEEVGSPVSRAITERLALESSAVFVLEPAQIMPDGSAALKTARKGIGNYRVQVTGVASHAGVDFERGHSAVLELARQIERISGFTNLGSGLTVNCGVISGGTRSNVVAAEAEAEVDVRIVRAAEAKRVDRLFRSLKPFDKACKVTVTGGINRPPMERKGGTIALFKQAKKLAAQLGFAIEEAATGGGSDGNFTAALGVPTLDGMGAVGAGAHASHEHFVVEHLAPRTALLAAMIAATE